MNIISYHVKKMYAPAHPVRARGPAHTATLLGHSRWKGHSGTECPLVGVYCSAVNWCTYVRWYSLQFVRLLAISGVMCTCRQGRRPAGVTARFNFEGTGGPTPPASNRCLEIYTFSQSIVNRRNMDLRPRAHQEWSIQGLPPAASYASSAQTCVYSVGMDIG